MPKKNKKFRKRWQGGLKETIELMLIRPPQLQFFEDGIKITATGTICLLYTSPSPRDRQKSRMPSSA